MAKANDVAGFYNLVQRKGPNECWPWRGGLNDTGYGRFTLDGVRTRAHRVAYALANGVQLQDLDVVRHTCDNPACCNPAHLVDGPQVENIQDMWEKGRGSRGEDNGLSKLTEGQVVEIIQLYATGNHPQHALGRQFGVDQSAISDILRGERWRHVSRSVIGDMVFSRGKLVGATALKEVCCG